MARPYSPELRYVIDEALDSCEQLGEELNSIHLIFALFMLDNSGGLLFCDEGYNEEALLPFVDPALPEASDAVEDLLTFSEETSMKYRNPEVNCLHLVVALCRHRGTRAYSMLDRAGVSVPKLRNRAISLLVNGMPKRYADLFREHDRRKRAMASAAASNPPSAARQAPVHQPETRRAVTAEIAPTSAARPRPTPGDRRFPVLSEVAVDMLAKVRAGEIEPVEERSRELMELIDILNKRKANNPLILGPSGVGKTALVEGLAWMMAFEPDVVPGLAGRRLFQLEVASMFKGTHLRGSFSERMSSLRREVREAQGDAIVFLDEIHTLVQGSVDGAQEIAQELKAALSRGEFPCIGATTNDEYKKTIEKDPALARRFHILELDEPDEEATLRVLASVLSSYEEHHGISFDINTLPLIVKLSNRYMRDRHQPDKSITILDLAGARARRSGEDQVTERTVAKVVSKLTSVPVDQLVLDDAERYLKLEDNLARRIVGHREVLALIAESLRRNVAGFGGERPMGSFLFVGPTGVGKTEIARALASELFGNRDAMVRFDMSEYAEPHSVAKLIGAPPGYVGYQEGGVLTDSMRRRPFQLVLFDEIEKGHPDIHQLLLQVLEDGRLTDNLGRTVDFTHAVVIMTSNLGSDIFSKSGRSLGFTAPADMRARRRAEVLASVKRTLAPEFYNRIDDKIVFEPLTKDEVRQVALLLMDRSAERLLKEKGIRLVFAAEVPSLLIDNGGYDPLYGARPMRRAIQSLIEGPLASMILRGDVRGGDYVTVADNGAGGFHFNVGDPAAEASGDES